MLVLFGPPGVGKSTLGKRLAQKLRLPFIDIDQCLGSPQELYRRCPVNYRKLEKQAVKNLPTHPCVIACGGGTVLDEDNVTELRKRGELIYMRCDLPTLQKRFDQGNRAMKVDLKILLMQRNPIYETLTSHVLDASITLEEQLQWAIDLATSLR